MAKSVLFNIYDDLVKALKPIVGAKYIFLRNRPKIKGDDVPMKRFAVVSIPAAISDYVIGNKKRHLVTTGVFYLFTQARSDDTLDVNAMGEFVDSIADIFPIVGDYVVASNPVVETTGSDGYGFQVTMISFDIHTK